MRSLNLLETMIVPILPNPTRRLKTTEPIQRTGATQMLINGLPDHLALLNSATRDTPWDLAGER